MLNKKSSLFLLLIILSNFLSAQNSEAYDPNKKYSKELLLTDFNLVVEYIEAVHPAPNRFISVEDLNILENEIKTELEDGMTEMEFHLLVRKYIKSIRCGHTVAFPSKGFYKQANLAKGMIPMDVVLLDNKIFIKRAYSVNKDLKVGAEICSINKEPIQTIIQKMKDMQELDGLNQSSVQRKVQRLFRTYFLIINGYQTTFEIEYCEAIDGIKTTTVTADEYKKPTANSIKSLNEIIHSAPNSKLYIHSEINNLAILDLNAFERKGFKKNHKAIFKALDSRNIEHFVIDLRGNGGGYFPNGNNFLSYLVDQNTSMNFSRRKNKINKSPHLKIPFYIVLTELGFNLIPDSDKNDADKNIKLDIKPKKQNLFDGQLYILTDGNSFSMSSFVSAKLNKYTNAIFIGEETGGAEFGSNAILSYSLVTPNTNTRINIPHFFLDHKVETEELGRGILPDYEIKYTLEEILSGSDKEMDKVVQLVNENSKE